MELSWRGLVRPLESVWIQIQALTPLIKLLNVSEPVPWAYPMSLVQSALGASGKSDSWSCKDKTWMAAQYWMHQENAGTQRCFPQTAPDTGSARNGGRGTLGGYTQHPVARNLLGQQEPGWPCLHVPGGAGQVRQGRRTQKL